MAGAPAKRSPKRAAPSDPEPTPAALTGDALLLAVGAGVECLCNNVTTATAALIEHIQANTQQIQAHEEQVQLLRHRLESMDRRWDRAELVLADLIGYPVTQEMLPNLAQLRDWIENGRAVRRKG